MLISLAIRNAKVSNMRDCVRNLVQRLDLGEGKEMKIYALVSIRDFHFLS